jgi:hypothetical protein
MRMLICFLIAKRKIPQGDVGAVDVLVLLLRQSAEISALFLSEGLSQDFARSNTPFVLR